MHFNQLIHTSAFERLKLTGEPAAGQTVRTLFSRFIQSVYSVICLNRFKLFHLLSYAIAAQWIRLLVGFALNFPQIFFPVLL